MFLGEKSNKYWATENESETMEPLWVEKGVKRHKMKKGEYVDGGDGKEWETAERRRQWEGGNRKRKRFIEWKGRGDGWKGRQSEGGKREREEGYYGERKGRQLKGGDSGKEERGKEKRSIEGKRRETVERGRQCEGGKGERKEGTGWGDG
jgi:hypothetical protein